MNEDGEVQLMTSINLFRNNYLFFQKNAVKSSQENDCLVKNYCA